MYESFYGLNAKPFSLLPDPSFLYLGKKHKIALTMLEYTLMNSAGFCVITGEIGAGKTTLLRKLLETIEDDITVGMITNTHQSFGELLDWVLSAYGIHQPGLGKVEMHQRLVDFLLEQYANNKTTLLIVDEAQNMPAATLEELRMLSNINSEKDLVLQIILAGQPGLRDTLKKPELMQFVQRISVDFHLDALTSDETCFYIQHRLVTAGAVDDILTPEACRLIHEYSGGVPRLINLLSDTALVYGFADQQKTIGVEIIDEMIRERMENSILPLANINRSKRPVKADNGNFPWISPNGGTQGLKPAAEKKTAEKAVFEIKQTKHNSFSDNGSAQPVVLDEAGATEVIVPVVVDVVSKNISDDIGENHNQVINKADAVCFPEEDVQASIPDDLTEPSPVAKANAAVNSVSELSHEEPEKFRSSNWIIALLLVLLAALLSISIGSFKKEAELKHEVKGKLVEVESMKRDLEHVQQQADVMQRERDAALAKALQKEKQRVQEEQAAIEAGNREKEAIAAAALAAEEALKAAKQAEELAKKQRLEEKRLSEERKRLQLEKKQAELEQQRLLQQRRQAELEKQRLELEKAQKEKLAQEERERRVAKEQAELFKSLEENDAAKAAVINQQAQENQKKETSFNTDPCSSPSAKFLSTCR